MSSQKRIAIVIIWMLVTTLGGTIGLTLGSTAGEQVGFPVGYQVEEFMQGVIPSLPSEFLPSMIAGLFYGSVMGLILGFLQWLFVLRTLKGGSILWIVLNLAGMGLVFLLNSGVFMFLISLGLDSFMLYFISACMSGPTNGAMLGVLHWLYFRRMHNMAFWWLVFDLSAWITLDLLFLFFSFFAPLDLPIVEIITNGVNSFLLSVFTGAALYLTIPESKESREWITSEG